MPSIIGSVSCSTGSHQPALVCFASALFALFLIGGSFPPRGRGSLARPILRPAWNRRYLFKFQHALGHRRFFNGRRLSHQLRIRPKSSSQSEITTTAALLTIFIYNSVFSDSS